MTEGPDGAAHRRRTGVLRRDPLRRGHERGRCSCRAHDPPPPVARAAFIRRLLTDLEGAGFGGAPRYLGTDAEGREVLSYIEGEVVHRGVAEDERIASAARLVRSYHDTTGALPLRGGDEIVAHTDLGPHNTVFQGAAAAAIIDWDDAGELLDEIAARFRRAIAEHRAADRTAAVVIFEDLASWLQAHRPAIEEGTERGW